MTRPTGDVLDDDDWMTFPIGTVTTLNSEGKRRHPPREFPIGFHVAAPGPSHDEDAPARRRKVPA